MHAGGKGEETAQQMNAHIMRYFQLRLGRMRPAWRGLWPHLSGARVHLSGCLASHARRLAPVQRAGVDALHSALLLIACWRPGAQRVGGSHMAVHACGAGGRRGCPPHPPC